MDQTLRNRSRNASGSFNPTFADRMGARRPGSRGAQHPTPPWTPETQGTACAGPHAGTVAPLGRGPCVSSGGNVTDRRSSEVPLRFHTPERLGLEKPATQQHQRARTKRPKKNLLFGWKLKKVTAHQTEHSQKKLRPPPHLCRQRPVGDSRLFPTTSCMEVTRCRWCQRRPGRGWESHLRCMVAGSTYPSSCGGGFRGD